ALTSYSAKGTYKGFDTDLTTVPVDFYAKAPNQRSIVIHAGVGDGTQTFDGRNGWLVTWERPVPLIELPPGADLDGMRLDAQFNFPAGIKNNLTGWAVGFPETAIDGKTVQVVQGFTPSRSRVKLFFDKQSGLLLRYVRYVVTPVGTV